MGEKMEKIEFDWVQLHKDMDAVCLTEETTKAKMLRKIKENPFVPIGVLATTGVLSYGLWCFRLGRKQMSQYMMRARIAAQGFTVVAMIVGIGMSASKLADNPPTPE